MILIDMLADAVYEMDRECTSDEIYAAVRDDLQHGETRSDVVCALSRAVKRGLIRRVENGKAGVPGNPGVFAPLLPVAEPQPTLRWVFDLASYPLHLSRTEHGTTSTSPRRC